MPVQVAGHVVEAAERIHKAFKGMGTDEKSFIAALTSMRPNDVMQLNTVYKGQFGKDITEAIEKELSGDFKNLAIDIVKGSAAVDAHAIHKAVKGLGTDEKKLALVLAGRTNADIEAIKAAYKVETDKDMEAALKGDLSGDLKHWYVALCQATRDENRSIHADIQGDVALLYKAGVDKVGTDETAFIRIFASRNLEHLRQVFAAYLQAHQQSIHSVLKKELSGGIEDALRRFADAVENPFIELADQLENSMKGLGTDEKELNRVAVRVWHQGWQGAVSAAYQAKYGKALVDRISGEIKGDHRKLMLAILGF